MFLQYLSQLTIEGNKKNKYNVYLDLEYVHNDIIVNSHKWNTVINKGGWFLWLASEIKNYSTLTIYVA